MPPMMLKRIIYGISVGCLSPGAVFENERLLHAFMKNRAAEKLGDPERCASPERHALGRPPAFAGIRRCCVFDRIGSRGRI